MIGGTTYVSSCYEKHLNNFSSGLLVCFCVLCCYSTRIDSAEGFIASQKGDAHCILRQCQHSSSRDDYGNCHRNT
uniref:Uncharacterized protein n=1 Tax=Anguilla anguilla TaxID=7936 RepID=A0A0E9PG57_ANGAN